MLNTIRENYGLDYLLIDLTIVLVLVSLGIFIGWRLTPCPTIYVQTEEPTCWVAYGPTDIESATIESYLVHCPKGEPLWPRDTIGEVP
jgi:hypothetical protein